MSPLLMGNVEQDKWQARLSWDQRQFTVIMFVRNQQVFDACRGTLPLDRLRRQDVALARIWSKAHELYEKFHEMPTQHMLSMEVRASFGAEGELDSPDCSMATEIMLHAWGDAYSASVVDSPKHIQYAIDSVGQWVHELFADSVRQDLASTESIVKGLPEYLQGQVDGMRVAQPGTDVSGLALFPSGWEDKPQLQLRSTGLDFLDDYLNGGVAPGESYLMMGPMGSCKTTMALQIAQTLVGQAAAAEALDPNDKQLVFYISLETPPSELRTRTLMYSAHVPRATVEAIGRPNLTPMELLSTTTSLKPYELAMYQKQLSQNLPVEGERERIDRATARLNRYLVPVDLTGGTHHLAYLRASGVSGIAKLIHAILRSRPGFRSAAVFIDYLGLLAKGSMPPGDYAKNLRYILGDIPPRAQFEIARAFECPLFLLAQLNGEANSRPPGSSLDFTKAGENKMLAENVDFCVQSGKLSIEGITRFGAGKHRRHKPMEDILIQLNGEFAYVDKVSTDRFRLQNNSIVNVGIAEAIHGAVDKPTRVVVRNNNKGSQVD